jgi:cytochrome c oxidase cbb3-type subunit 4
MSTATYEGLRQFADSWGLLYMVGILLVVMALLFWRGAGQRASDAARIPLMDDQPPRSDPK